jgi:hypothetical protein
MCKRAHWQAVMETTLYYVSELRLARHIGSNDLPEAGETVQFLANSILGTAVIQAFHHNGYAGHFVLRNIRSTVTETPGACPESTDLLQKASPSVRTNLQALEFELFQVETEQQVVAASFAALESQKRSISRRLAGKPVQLTEKRKRARRSEEPAIPPVATVPTTPVTPITPITPSSAD